MKSEKRTGETRTPEHDILLHYILPTPGTLLNRITDRQSRDGVNNRQRPETRAWPWKTLNKTCSSLCYNFLIKKEKECIIHEVTVDFMFLWFCHLCWNWFIEGSDKESYIYGSHNLNLKHFPIITLYQKFWKSKLLCIGKTSQGCF